MGSMRSAPDKQKNSGDSNKGDLSWGYSSMCGWRLNMEDAHIIDETTLNGKPAYVFGIFDGHGGPEVAEFVKENFMKTLVDNNNFKKMDIKKALEETFLQMDKLLESPKGKDQLFKIREKNKLPTNNSGVGCTANVCLIYSNKIYCANTGDSRSVLWAKKKVIPLSKDHKPDDPIEIDRIKKAGLKVENGRIEGLLNLSRAIGDLSFKDNKLQPCNQAVTAMPDVTTNSIQGIEEFIVMGCDGIWECLSEKSICQFLQTNMKSKISMGIENLFERILARDQTEGVGCDNMSCIVIALGSNKSN